MTVGISRDGLHVVLWNRRGANNTLRVDQTRLAGELQVTKHTINRVLARMVSEGRMEPCRGSRPGSTSTYVITDPDDWPPTTEEST